TNNSIRKVAERFQRSNETISCCFREVLAALTSDGFRQEYMKLPCEGDGVPDRIQKDPKLFPFFQDCVGAIDGSHMFVRPPSATRGPWRDRK
ncbi:uncharacterized protein SCHCODRAFT_01050781, partial [Schizophyllum commune H4-8]|uniref:uncharacterized protein n=1 Tax=Schizophyllum commune (strain H4-8 / FGSC 9210) TaxID=578458 RepID=UPI00215E6313